MTTLQIQPVPLASRDEDEAAWFAARAEGGVTATEAAKLLNGGIRTRKRIARDKDHGSSFHGNQHTERGRRREPYLAAFAKRKFGLESNSTVYARGRLLCTPDLLSFRYGPDEEVMGGEIKSTTHDWSGGTPMGTWQTIPRDYYHQCLFSMIVFGVRRWLFIWEQVDEDGQPLDPEPAWFWIDYNPEHAAKLVQAAEDFLAWREAGMPLIDPDLPEEISEALNVFAAGRALSAEGKALETEALAVIRPWVLDQPGALEDGLRKAGAAAEIRFDVTHTTEHDPAAWARRAPRQHAQFLAARTRFVKPKTKTKLTITLTKREAA